MRLNKLQADSLVEKLKSKGRHTRLVRTADGNSYNVMASKNPAMVKTESEAKDIARTMKAHGRDPMWYHDHKSDKWVVMDRSDYREMVRAHGKKKRNSIAPKDAPKPPTSQSKRFAVMGRQGKKNAANLGRHVSTIKHGKATAEVWQHGPNAFSAVIRAGNQTLTIASKTLQGAMTWARLKIHDMARAMNQNPFGVLDLVQADASLGKDSLISKAGKLLTSTGKKPRKSKKNPMESAEKTFEEFHGYPSKEVLEYVEKEHRHSVLAGVGTLTSMEVVNVKGNRVVELMAPEPSTSSFEDVVQVAVSEDGRQLYLVGGDQSIPLEVLQSKFGMNEHDIRDKMVIGTIRKLTYRTKKSFEKGGREQIDFYHKLGGEQSRGVMPVLEYKPKNPSMEIVGGRYFIAKKDRGLGASPGIVG